MKQLKSNITENNYTSDHRPFLPTLYSTLRAITRLFQSVVHLLTMTCLQIL